MSTGAVIVVGGEARRLDGVGKPWLSVGERAIIDWVVDAAEEFAQEIVLVGASPLDWSRTGIRWTVESPAGSGPAAACAAGLAALGPEVDEVLLLAGDAPFVQGPVQALFAAAMVEDGVVVEADGQLQYLCARIKRKPLTDALGRGGPSMRSAFDHLRLARIPAVLRDADTWEDVVRLRQETPMNEWLASVTQKLNVDPVMDTDAILDLARDVAHHTERKNAPLTSYLLGYAAGVQGLTRAQIAAIAAELGQLAKDSE